MATTRIRMTTYVDAPTAELVKTTASALDQTTSALLADMVSYGVPMLEVMRDMALAIKAHPDQARARSAAFAAALRPLADEAIKGIESLERGEPFGPPPSNRGGSS